MPLLSVYKARATSPAVAIDTGGATSFQLKPHIGDY